MIVPSIDLMDGRAVQLVNGRDLAIDAGDPRPIAERFARAGEVAVIDLDAALGRGDNSALIRELISIAPCRVGGGIRSSEKAIEWLDAGARRVIIGTAARPEVLEPLPRERVVAALDARDGDVVVEGWTRTTGRSIEEGIDALRDLVGGFLITFVEVEGTLGGLPFDRAAGLIALAAPRRVTFAGGVATAGEVGALDGLGADAQVGMALYSGRLPLGDAIAAPLTSDRPDGLWPTVVEESSGRVLGLAWSDAESLREAVDRGRGVYRSRSRGLWRKGQTSGATQDLLRVRVDCDRDALLFTVRQRGAGFCHTGAVACFDEPGAPRESFGLRDLEARVRSRLTPPSDGSDGPSPSVGSLTARLAREPGLLAGKLLEEAQELAEAGSARHAVAELADLLYFAVTSLVVAGGSVADVERELARRALRVSRRAPRAPTSGVEPGRRSGGGPALSPTGGQPLPTVSIEEAVRRVRRFRGDGEVSARAAAIVEDVRRRGVVALEEHAARLDGWDGSSPLAISPDRLHDALRSLPRADREVLRRTADRIDRFARAQRETATDLSVTVPGGRAGHRLVAIGRAGCYAPGGRFPLPSSVLMTAIPARVAGVESVWVASPRPTAHTLAAAAVAGVDGLLAAGGAQAIAALAFGIGGPPPSDIVAGPGNRFVTAAKRHLFGEIGIDLLAGPSEVLIVADTDAPTDEVAADLLAQAEHDPDAVPIVCVRDAGMIEPIRETAVRRARRLTTRETAEASLRAGGVLLARTDEEIVDVVERLAPEHLQLVGAGAERLASRIRSYGSLFIGRDTPEVLGDYGIGPNHSLPTGGTARFADGLSVFTFLRRPTWVEADRDDAGYPDVVSDAEALAGIEGLEGHARAARLRRPSARGPDD